MLSILPKEFVFSLVRHALTVGAGYLVAKGFTDADSAQALIGGVMGTVAVAWAHWTHTP
jgi:hypothetical protein